MFLINRIVELRLNAKESRETEKELRRKRSRTGSGGSKESKKKSDVNEEVSQLRRELKHEYKRALRETWKKCQGHTGLRKIDQLLHEVFARTFEQDARMKAMILCATFQETSTDRPPPCISSGYGHARFLACVLDYIINPSKSCYSDFKGTFGPNFIGQRHQILRSAGFSSHFWELFGENLVDKMVRQDSVRCYPFGMKAWSLLCAMLTDRLRAGFEQQYGMKTEMLGTQILAPFALRRQSLPKTQTSVREPTKEGKEQILKCAASVPNTPEIRRKKTPPGGAERKQTEPLKSALKTSSVPSTPKTGFVRKALLDTVNSPSRRGKSPKTEKKKGRKSAVKSEHLSKSVSAPNSPAGIRKKSQDSASTLDSTKSKKKVCFVEPRPRGEPSTSKTPKEETKLRGLYLSLDPFTKPPKGKQISPDGLYGINFVF